MMKRFILLILIYFNINCFIIYLPAGSSLYAAETPNVIHKRALKYAKEKKYSQAVEEFDRALKLHNESAAKIYHNKGWVLELKGDLKNAIVNYKEALRCNPMQIHTGERLGFLYYKTGDYINAVQTGEMVIKLDPKNSEVPKWLPDAYMKKLQQEKELEEALRKKEEEERKKREEEKKRREEEKKKEEIIFYATMDFMLRFGYYPKGDKGFEFVEDRGLVDVPETFYARYTPTENWRFDLTLENPYLGAMSPNLVVHTEQFELMYWYGDYMIGGGAMVNHYAGDISFGENKKLWDLKLGYIFGFKKKKATMRVSFYPRLLLRDSEASSGETYDVNSVNLDYTYQVHSSLKYYLLFRLRDYYFFDHEAGLSDYWGVYDFGIGVTLGSLIFNPRKTSYTFNIEYIQRYYLEDLQNDDPYGTFNGQGWFGINSSKWAKGSPFSGGKGTSSVLSFRIDERFRRNYFFYQKFLMEIGELKGEENHHEFNLQLGAGLIF